jgi:HK97 family phage major capsid protein
MANITAATVKADFNSGFLTPAMSAPIFEQAARQSVVQSIVPQTALGINGQSIPYVSGKMGASWVEEAGQKPTSKGAVNLKSITPHKIAAIAVVSAEVVRANPGNYVNLIRPQIAEAFAVAFDNGALYNLGPDGTGAGVFGTYLAQTSKAVQLVPATPTGATAYDGVVAGLEALVTDTNALGRHYRLNGFVLDDTTEPIFLGAKDGNDRPLYIDTPLTETTAAAARPGRLINRPTFMAEGVAQSVPVAASTAYTVAFGGDFTQAAWGVVGGISFDVSTQTAVTIGGELVSLWEHNLLAIRAEAEYGFLVNDPEAFVAFQLKTASA